jgi:GAF domain-containing protein
LGTENFYVTLYDEQRDELLLALEIFDNQPDEQRLGQAVDKEGITGYMFARREPVLLADRILERVEELGIKVIRLSPDRISESWLGVPIMVGARVLGTMVAMDYETPRAYDEHHRDLLSALANQTAIALENVRLLEQTRAALADAEATHRSYLRRAWQDHLRQREMLDRSSFLYDETAAEQDLAWVADRGLWRPEMEQALLESTRATSNGGHDDDPRAGLAIPIVVRGQTIGVLGVESPTVDREWSEDDLAIIESVGEQLGQTLETARLFADTQRRAERERLIGEITAKLRASSDMDDILETAATELGQALGTSRAVVRVSMEGLRADTSGPGQQEGVSQEKGQSLRKEEGE